MQQLKLIDRHLRHINYLRISITDRCNLNCTYCLPGKRIPKISHGEVLTYEEILRLVRIGTRMGIAKVRVTGGEPLVRKGVYRFLESLRALPGIRDISLTTNGVLLHDNLTRIASAGIRRLNISMDTLDSEKYASITGRDAFHRVWKGIHKARRMGFAPIKLNVVAIRGINDTELAGFAALSRTEPYHIRFIEYMPIGDHHLKVNRPLMTDEIKTIIEKSGRLMPVKKDAFDGPAQRFRFEGAAGEIGFISAMSHHFCSTCNRLRLTADGHLRPCLLSDLQEDVREAMRRGCGDRELANIFLKAVRYKKSAHHLAHGASEKIHSRMSSIGG